MRKFICLIAFAILFQIIGCKDQLIDPIPQPPFEEGNSLSTEVLGWDEAVEDQSFQQLLGKLGDLDSNELTLKGATRKKTIKLQKSKVKKNKLGDYESFTLLVDSLDFENLSFTNLVIEKKQDNSSAFIIKYFPTRKWIAHYINGIYMDFDGKVSFQRINLNDYSLKMARVCEHYTIFVEHQCTAGGEHWPGEGCDGSCSQQPWVEILFDGEICYEDESGGGDSPQTISPPTTEGGATGGGGTSDYSDSEPSITTILSPYDDNNITALTLVNDLFGIELGPSADIDIEDFELFDPDSEILIEGKNVAYDNKGGFYFIDLGKLIYYRDGMCYVYVNRVYGWREAGTGFNYFISIVEDALSQPLNYLLTAFAQMTPIDGAVTVITGENILGMEENQIVAGGFLLFEIVPGTKILRPVKKIIQDVATKYIAKKGALVIELIIDLKPVIDDDFIKFSAKSLDDLAEVATKNADAATHKVMLGKYLEDSPLSYDEIARAENFSYYDLDGWDELKAMVNYNDDEMWEINKKFIDNQISLNKQFYFSHNPNEATGFFKREVDYLKSKLNIVEFPKVGEYWTF